MDVQASVLFNRCYAALVNNAEIEPTSRSIEDGRAGCGLYSAYQPADLADPARDLSDKSRWA